MKIFKRIFIALLYLFPFLAYFLPEFYLDLRSDGEIDPLFWSELGWYYLLIALPFTVYALIGELIKKLARKGWLFLLVLIAPLVSIAFSAIYFDIFGSAGYMFGSGLLIILMAIVHFVVAVATAIIIYL